MIDKTIGVAKGFQTSVNIAYDLYNDEKVSNFIPTMSSLDVIEDVLLSTAATSSQRARILIGAYGRGKSHIILVLMSLLFKKDKALFQALLNKMKDNNSQLFEFAKNYIDSSQKLLPIIVRGSSASLSQSFLSSLQQALAEKELSDLMPDTHFKAALNMIENWKSGYPDTYKKLVATLSVSIDTYILSLKEYDVAAYEKFNQLYPNLTSGGIFNPFIGFDIVELYEKITERLKDKGYNGVYIIYDEFSKYLESSIANATISDIKLLQDFAEKCDRSGAKQMHLMLICHKDIANYIDKNLPKEKVDGWRGVSGRFKHINLHNNFSQMYEIISAVIKKDIDSWYRANKDRFDDLTKRFTANKLLDANNQDEVKNAIIGCYPLHPISTFILPRLSEKVAQNERTLFTFLSSEDKYTLTTFIQTAKDEFPMLTPDYIYDYFEPLLRKEPYTSETHKLYKLTSNVLRKVDEKSLGAKIIKTISLIYIIEQFEKLPPIYNVIVDAYRDSIPDTKLISEALTELIEKDCIVYLKRSNNFLKIKESSGVDIPSEISSYIEKNKMTLSVKDILNQSSFDSFMYPTRYNDEFEITRYFDFTFIYSSDFWATENWNLKTGPTGADGIVFAIIPTCQAEIEKLAKALQTEQYLPGRVVFVLPQEFIEIEKIALEYEAVKNLKALVLDDELLADEYDIYIEDLTEVISSFINCYARPENGGASYYYCGEQQRFSRKAQMSELLSRICELSFPNTPIINNESINKNILPTVAINSRSKLLAGLLENELAPNLGLSGTGQDVSIMRSTLIQTGILINVDTTPTIELEPADNNIRNMLRVIHDFFTGANANGGRNFKEVYDRLTLHEHGIGLKSGVIPIFIAVVLHLFKKSIVIKCKDYEEKITPSLLNNINEHPENYSVILENWSEDKAIYMEGLEAIFSGSVTDREKTYNSFTYLVLAMNRWYMALPKYTKDLENIYCGLNAKEPYKALSKSKKRFLNSLKQVDPNAREYLFEKLFSIFGMSEFSSAILNSIKNTKIELENTIFELTRVLAADIKLIFSINNANGSMTSTIRDWYETLSESTLQYLFSRGENRVLELMKTITNDEAMFVGRLAKAITGLRIDDWSRINIDAFIRDLRTFKETVDEYNSSVHNEAQGTDIYKIVFTDSEGNEVTKSFNKTKYSNKAKLLFNEMITALEDMGQAITEQEKRQVLMDILERLC